VFLHDVEVSDDVDRRVGRDQREHVDFVLTQFATFDLDDVLACKAIRGDVHPDGNLLAVGAVDTEDGEDVQRLAPCT